MDKKEKNFKEVLNFLTEINCLNQLDEYTNKFNIFDILRITKTEIRHSNILAWFLNPDGEHGFKYKIIEDFIKFARENDDSIDFSNASITVEREYENIDILVVIDEPKIVLCIENKTFTSEHDSQLQRYRNYIENNYVNYEKLYIYLSPNGLIASDDNWKTMTYDNVLEMLELAKEDVLYSDKGVEVLIEHYIDAVKNYLATNVELQELCKKIYKKYYKALDLIYDYGKFDYSIQFEWAEGKHENNELILNKKKCSASYIRFTTERMSNVLPDDNDNCSNWGTNNFYFYELTETATEYHIKLAINYTAIVNPTLKDNASKIIEFKGKKCGKWTKVIEEKVKKDNYNNERILNILDELFNKVLVKESEIVGLFENNNNI